MFMDRRADGTQGAAIIQAITPGTLNVRTQLSAGTSIVQGLFIEMFLTALFALSLPGPSQS
jgi:aquaporin related protein